MDDTTPEYLRGKLRLLATQALALSVCMSNIAEAVLTKDDAHAAMLIERVEGDLSQIDKSLGEIVRSL